MRASYRDLTVARYVQILSGGFLEQLGLLVINIHHTFLPASERAAPYQRAKHAASSRSAPPRTT